MLLKKFSVAALLGGLLVLSGCGGGGGTDDKDPQVYFVNGSADSIALNFTMDDVAADTNVPYLGGSGGWRTYDFKEESTDGYDVAVLATDTLFEFDRFAQVFQRDTQTVVFAIGQRTIAPGEDAKRLRLIPGLINNVRPNGNKARLFVLHGFNRAAGLNTPAIVFKNPGDIPQYQTPPIEYATSAILETDSGTFTFEARRADGEAIYATASQTLEPGGVYLVSVTGIENDPDPNKRPRITFLSLPTRL